ncbi:hypothetical protein [Psychromonas aquimarina]|uniref:hypothetical protein n=1 Tax=Psychromonas aquimarina TaxID=444919 RepID=UPI00040AA4FF|nr:hypothetical protein [Psychromonas aquimarina]
MNAVVNLFAKKMAHSSSVLFVAYGLREMFKYPKKAGHPVFYFGDIYHVFKNQWDMMKMFGGPAFYKFYFIEDKAIAEAAQEFLNKHIL